MAFIIIYYNKLVAHCGFSNQLIKVLNQISIDYGTFDIFSDEEVRRGLKVYFDWPIYSHAYVKDH